MASVRVAQSVESARRRRMFQTVRACNEDPCKGDRETPIYLIFDVAQNGLRELGSYLILIVRKKNALKFTGAVSALI